MADVSTRAQVHAAEVVRLAAQRAMVTFGPFTEEAAHKYLRTMQVQIAFGPPKELAKAYAALIYDGLAYGNWPPVG